MLTRFPGNQIVKETIEFKNVKTDCTGDVIQGAAGAPGASGAAGASAPLFPKRRWEEVDGGGRIAVT